MAKKKAVKKVVKVKTLRKLRIKFEKFWAVYPRHENKKVSELRWNNLTIANQHIVMSDLEKRKTTESWQKNGGMYIPFASSYLNQERWNDALIYEPKSVTIKYD